MLKPSWCYLKCLYKSKYFYSANEIVCFKQALDYLKTIENNSPEENKWYKWFELFLSTIHDVRWELTALVLFSCTSCLFINYFLQLYGCYKNDSGNNDFQQYLSQ